MHLGVVIHRQRRVVAELDVLEHRRAARRGSNARRGDLVDGAAKNPLSVGHQQQNFVQQAQRIRP